MANVKVYDENHRLLGAIELSNDGSLIASQDVLGNVKIGSNINVSDDGTISVPNALQNVAGVISVANVPSGAGRSSYDDTCSANIDGKIAIKKGSTSSYGVVQIGDLLKIDENGKLTIDVENLKTALDEPVSLEDIGNEQIS